MTEFDMDMTPVLSKGPDGIVFGGLLGKFPIVYGPCEICF